MCCRHVPPRWRWWHWYSWSNLAVAWYTWNHANQQITRGRTRTSLNLPGVPFCLFLKKNILNEANKLHHLKPLFIVMNNGEQGLCVDGVQLNWTKLKVDYQRSLSLDIISGVRIGDLFGLSLQVTLGAPPMEVPVGLAPHESFMQTQLGLYNSNFFSAQKSHAWKTIRVGSKQMSFLKPRQTICCSVLTCGSCSVAS